jgi:membrane-bound lytic murein transglycosylase MltF
MRPVFAVVQRALIKTTLSCSLALIPLQGFSENLSLYDQIQQRKTLKVAAVADNSTFFGKGNLLHGFGYDLTRELAQNLNVRLEFKPYASSSAALRAVAQGKADLALSTASTRQLDQHDLHPVSLSCGKPALLSSNGLNTAVNWALSSDTDPLMASLNSFACQEVDLGVTPKLAAFYTQNVMNNAGERSSLRQAINTRLPQYVSSMQAYARQNRLDWQLVAAVGYQESHWQPDAISPTGVQGLMMLTAATASEVGVADRTDPMQSISGGARYLSQLQRQYSSLPRPDRLWFSLAAYNMGPGALDQVRRQVKKSGQNPNHWPDVYRYMADRASKNGSYSQAVRYVTRIRAYLETLKQDRALSRL